MINYLPFIKQTLLNATQVATRNFGRIGEVTTKSGDNNQVLTETDLEIGKLIVAEIQKTFPDYNIIDEEAGVIDKKSNYTFVVDPIDGTSNFANGLPTYGIMIGLLESNLPIAGGISLPYFSQIYLAQKGRGVSCNDQPIKVTSEAKLDKVLVAYGIDGHQEDPERTTKEVETLGKIILGIRNLRTTNSAYDMAQIAVGKYGAYLNQTTKIWDNIAIQPIIEEAGGLVTDFWGKPLDYTNHLNRSQENFTVCAGPKVLHDQLQAIIRS